MSASAVFGDGNPLRYLPAAIRLPERPLRAIAFGWLTSFPVSILLSALAAAIFSDSSQPRFDVGGLTAVFALVIFAPVVETLIMGVVLMLLQTVLKPGAAVFVSALGWGVAHSLAAPAWGIVIWWPFLIFSTLFVTWRRRSLPLAFLIPMCVHALQNLPPALLVARGLAG